MTLGSNAVSEIEQRCAGLLAEALVPSGRQPLCITIVPPIASPTHSAVASDCVRVDLPNSSSLFLKLRLEEMANDVVPWAAAAARKAAECGVAPQVQFASASGLIIDYLPTPWRPAKVGDLQDIDVMAAVLDAKKRLHQSGLVGQRFNPFERIGQLVREAKTVRAPLPDDTGRLVEFAELAREAITASGIDLRFCHNDGIASNIMLGEGVRLVDFDLAGDNDPWFDVGALVNEVYCFDYDAREAFERYTGHFDERLYNRCRLYGAVDDLMWGLWGVIRAVTSKRAGIEFFKYGTWRLFHARTAINSRESEALLRRL